MSTCIKPAMHFLYMSWNNVHHFMMTYISKLYGFGIFSSPDLTLSLPQAIIIGFGKQHRSKWDGSYESSHLDLCCLTFSLSTLHINFLSSNSLLKKEKQTTNVIWNLAPKELTSEWAIVVETSVSILTVDHMVLCLNPEIWHRKS